MNTALILGEIEDFGIDRYYRFELALHYDSIKG